MSEVKNRELEELFGVKYFEPGEKGVITANQADLYHYKTYIGEHNIDVEFGDCAFWLSDDQRSAHLTRGPANFQSNKMATVVRGYMPENKMTEIVNWTNLPYINGCSTKQVFPPERLGDPTLQILNIPPHSAEQAHHIHSTARVVYILSGTGYSIVGMEKKGIREKLYPGKVIVLEKMCPHHFETNEEHLIALPLHVWSSIAGLEHNHPMFNGTHRAD